MPSQTVDTEIAQGEMRRVPLEELREASYNPRRHFDLKQLKDLVESVKSKGVLTPLLVRPVKDYYEIVAGARRFRASKAAGLNDAPVIVRILSDQEALEVAVIDNLQRVDVHPLDEAEGYAALLKQPGYDVAAIAGKVGKSESYVYQRLKLAELAEPAKKAFLQDRITAGHAILIARLRPEDQKEALEACFGWDEDTLVSVRDAARKIEGEILTDLNKAPWNKADPELVNKAGACTTCPKRSGACPQLFDDIKKGDRCLDRACFATKMDAHFERLKAKYKDCGLPVVLLSESYSGPPGVYTVNRWHRLHNKKKCDKLAKGIIRDGGNRGQVLDVCIAMRCPIHSGFTEYCRDPKEVEKQKAETKKDGRESELEKALFVETVKKAPSILSRDLLERVALHASDTYGLPDVIDQLFPWRITSDEERSLHKLSDAELAKYLTALAFVEGGGAGEFHSKLKSYAKEWKVDVAAIEARLKTKWKEEDEREAQRVKEKVAKGEKLAAKAKAAK